jgi:hypothetical protein
MAPNALCGGFGGEWRLVARTIWRKPGLEEGEMRSLLVAVVPREQVLLRRNDTVRH